MTDPTPLTRYRQNDLDKITRCPSCGEWTYWPSIGHYLEAEYDTQHCHHGTNNEESAAA